MTATRSAARLDQILRRAADSTMAYPFKGWGFGEGIAMLGLLGASRAMGDARYADLVRGLFARWWALRDGTLAWDDHVTPGVPLSLLAHSDPHWLPAARALGDLYRRFPRRDALPIHRPDLAPWSAHVWVDCLYTDGPFLALLAHLTGERDWHDVAVEHAQSYVNVLCDAGTGLFFHGFDAATGRTNGVRWGRGNGWALLGLVDLLRFLPRDHPARARLAAVVRRQIDVLIALQDASGHWHTILDDPATYLEPSVAAMLASAVPQAIRLSVIPPEECATAQAASDAAFDAALRSTDDDGRLTGVSEATPASGPETYTQRPTGVYPWGQGPLLLAITDRLAPDAVWGNLA